MPDALIEYLGFESAKVLWKLSNPVLKLIPFPTQRLPSVK